MFLNKNYILANELVNKMGINIANISILKKQYEYDGDDITIIKMNNCSFIKSTAHKLPNNIKAGIAANTFTDMTNKLPCTWVHNEYELTNRELMNSNIVSGKVKVAGKDFYEFNEDFVKSMKNKVVYMLDKAETEECMRKGQIQGAIEMSKNKYLTWYSKYD